MKKVFIYLFFITLIIFGGFILFKNSAYNKSLPLDKKPNIIIIVGEGLGYSDISPYGGEINTPNLQKLANEGICFSQFYSMANLSHSHSTMLTGLYKGGLNAVSLTQIFKKSGYYIAHAGQEHWAEWTPEHVKAKYSSDKLLIAPNKNKILTKSALRWLNEPINNHQPFFLFLGYESFQKAEEKNIIAYSEIYKKGWDDMRKKRMKKLVEKAYIPKGTKANSKQEFPEWESLEDDTKHEMSLEMAHFAASVEEMDENIGQIMNYLNEKKIADNTIVIFLSDNGYNQKEHSIFDEDSTKRFESQSSIWAKTRNTPYAFLNKYGYAGGMQVNFILRWKKVVKPGKITNQKAHIVDIAPTLFEAAKVKFPKKYGTLKCQPLQGSSLLPILQGKKRKELNFFISGDDKLKLFQQQEWRIVKIEDQDWALYNLDTDPTETKNLASDEKEKLKELINAFEIKSEMLNKNYKKKYSE